MLNGTDGVGCRVIDLNDDDGDGLINELDLICPNTPLGEQVNADGCSQSELDDDEDGVNNNLDLCPDTPAGLAVDAEGCSEAQRNIGHRRRRIERPGGHVPGHGTRR